MKIKISTTIDKDLYLEFKVQAAKENRPVSEILSELIKEYMEKANQDSTRPS